MFCLCVCAWLHMSCFVDDVMLLRSRLCLCGVHMISSCPCTHLAQERTTSSGPPSLRALIPLGADRLRLSSRRSHRPSKNKETSLSLSILVWSCRYHCDLSCRESVFSDSWICYIVQVTLHSDNR